jgi:hypothetical protein
MDTANVLHRRARKTTTSQSLRLLGAILPPKAKAKRSPTLVLRLLPL